MKTKTESAFSETSTPAIPSPPRIPAVFLQFAIPYSVVTAVLFLTGYWETFGVSPLEYAGASDLVRLSAYPLTWLAFLTVFLLLLNEALWATTKGLMRWASNRPWPLLVVSYGALAILIATGLHSWYARHNWGAVPTMHFLLVANVLVSLVIAISLGSSQTLEWISRSKLVRKVVVLAVLAPLTGAFSFGRILGEANLKDECAFVEVDLARSGIVLEEARGATYIGNLGGHIFMREWDTGAVVITRLSDGVLVLLPRVTRAQGRPEKCSENASSDASGESVIDDDSGFVVPAPL